MRRSTIPVIFGITWAAVSANYYCGTVNPIPALPSAEDWTLRQVQIFVRHGDRVEANEAVCWPNDQAQYNCTLQQLQQSTLDHSVRSGRFYDLTPGNGTNFLPGNCLIGQLTSIGFNQQNQNGKNLNAAYVQSAGLLPEDPSACPDCYALRADNSARTIKSAQALFDGMYPSSAQSGLTVWPLETRDEYFETITANPNNCPYLIPAMAAAQSSPAFVAHVANTTKPLLAKLEAALNMSVSTGLLLDCYEVHDCHGLPIPDVLTKTGLAEAAMEDQVWQSIYSLNFQKVAYYSAAPLMAEVRQHMLNAMGQNSGVAKKFLLYSGHDTGPMMPTLAAFGLLKDKWAPYASLISMELYESSTTPADWAVRFVYNGTVMNVPGCSDAICPWADFEKILSNITSVLEHECKEVTIEDALRSVPTLLKDSPCASLNCPAGAHVFPPRPKDYGGWVSPMSLSCNCL